MLGLRSCWGRLLVSCLLPACCLAVEGAGTHGEQPSPCLMSRTAICAAASQYAVVCPALHTCAAVVCCLPSNHSFQPHDFNCCSDGAQVFIDYRQQFSLSLWLNPPWLSLLQ